MLGSPSRYCPAIFGCQKEMESTNEFTQMVERSSPGKTQIVAVVGISPQSFNSALHSNKDIRADKLASYAKVCGYTLALVPSDYAKFLPEQAIVIGEETEAPE